MALSLAACSGNGSSQEPVPTMTGKHVTIIHGYVASPQDHWFPWLKAKLEAQGAEVAVLALPDSANPRADAWLAYLKANIHHHDRNSYFVAHSLGCITLLRYLDGLDQPTPIGGFVLVSGFADSLSLLPQLDDFTREPLNYPHLTGLAMRRSVIASRNDPVVPYRQTAALSRSLKAELHSIDHGGHFLGSEGFTELPPVYDELARMIRHKYGDTEVSIR
ncbi:MAG: hydrolase [Hydrocarboniphaga sp.]|nr:hydrolase [Hydrocarboniphaga sp.]